MGSLSDVSIGDLLAALGRYRPVVFTVAAILVVLWLLPKPEGLASTAAAGGRIPTPAEPVAGADAATVAANAPADELATVSSGSSETFSPSATSFSSGSSVTSGDSSSSSFDTTSTTAFEPSSEAFVPSDSSSLSASSGPLRIVSKAWASRTSGTPLAAQGVPTGTLPVGTHVQDDKLSFVRLSGDELVLHLVEDASGARSGEGTASVQACPITTPDWQDGEAIAIGAISYDTGNCAQGVRGENGVWAFDLGKFSSRSGGNGFALVPGEDAGLDYQVCFKVS